MGNLGRTATALEGFDPIWQRDLIAMAYREFARHGRTRRARQPFAEELFALNRGALLQSGVALPVEIDVSFADANGSRRGERTLRRALGKAGFDRPVPARAGGARFVLDIVISPAAAGGYVASSELIDTGTWENTLRRTLPLRSMSGADIYAFAADLSRAVFRVD